MIRFPSRYRRFSPFFIIVVIGGLLAISSLILLHIPFLIRLFFFSLFSLISISPFISVHGMSLPKFLFHFLLFSLSPKAYIWMKAPLSEPRPGFKLETGRLRPFFLIPSALLFSLRCDPYFSLLENIILSIAYLALSLIYSTSIFSSFPFFPLQALMASLLLFLLFLSKGFFLLPIYVMDLFLLFRKKALYPIFLFLLFLFLWAMAKFFFLPFKLTFLLPPGGEKYIVFSSPHPFYFSVSNSSYIYTGPYYPIHVRDEGALTIKASSPISATLFCNGFPSPPPSPSREFSFLLPPGEAYLVVLSPHPFSFNGETMEKGEHVFHLQSSGEIFRLSSSRPFLAEAFWGEKLYPAKGVRPLKASCFSGNPEKSHYLFFNPSENPVLIQPLSFLLPPGKAEILEPPEPPGRLEGNGPFMVVRFGSFLEEGEECDIITGDGNLPSGRN
ncbi:MAG: hypothetical protein QXH03_00265 [Candidatus Bathyarchaeia archaeon]